MDYEKSIKVQLDTFQFNAGIIGFIYAMQFAGKEKGVDYDYDRHTLYISRELLENSEEMANIYCDALIEKYAKGSVVNKILTADYDNLPMSELKKFDLWCNRKTTNNVCDLLGENEIAGCISGYVKSKEEETKRSIGKQFVEAILSNNEMRRHLYLSDIALFKMSIFFNSLGFLIKQQGSFNTSCKENFATQIQKDIFENIFVEKKTGDFDCINCGEPLSNKIKMTFLRGSVADMDKKTSTFWDKKADTFLCPICYMMYAFMPLGFSDIGRGAVVFVNVNDSVDVMYKLNQITVKDETEDVYKQTYNEILTKLIDLNLKYVNTMQVVSKDKDNRYVINNLSKDKFDIIKAGQHEMGYMSKSYWKIGDTFINIYREVLDNIISFRNQYTLLAKLIRSEYNNSYILFNILKMQIIKNNINEEGKMEKKFNVAYVAKKYGNELRNMFGSEADNKMRGFCYQLLNAVQANNIELFSDRIIRMYVGMQKPIPEIFINGFKGEEEFKTIGYAYIMGLKGENKNNQNEENKGNE